MAQFEPFKNEIERAGAQVVFVAAEKRNGVWNPARFLEKHPISFPFLLDEDRSVIKSYGLYQRLGMDAIHIARAATLGVDRSGVIRYIYRGANQQDRSPMEPVIEALRKSAG